MVTYTHKEHPVLKSILHMVETVVVSILVALAILFILLMAFSAAGSS